MPRLAPAFGRVTRQLLAGFSAGEIGQLTAMLERMRGNLRDDGDSARNPPPRSH